jgi:glycine oxidase
MAVKSMRRFSQKKDRPMNIGIAGAGLMGRLLGWQLSRLGHTISLFDHDPSGQSSAAYIAAGMLSPFAESVVSQDIILSLGLESLAIWPQLINSISPDIKYKQSGCIVTCHQNDSSELLNFIQRLSTKIDKNLIKSLTTDALRQLEPELKFAQGYHLTLEGHIDSQQFIQALNHYFDKTHTAFHKARVKYVIPHAIFTDEQRHNFDFVFDCRGHGGNQHFPDLRSVRGEIIKVHAPDVNISRTIRLTHPRYPLYIVPLDNHHYIIGATEIESDDTSPISIRSCLELLNAAYSVHTGFAEARILKTNTALRPTLIDNSPRIIYEDGFIAINGLYRHGFLIAPALMQECIKLFRTGKTNNIHPELVMEPTHAN